LEDAIKLVFKATFESLGGEIFVMKMPTCRIIDLANVLIEASGKEMIEIETLGIRPGEKIHELLLSEYESATTITYDDEYYVILPPIYIKGLKEYYSQYAHVNLEKYDSSKEVISKEEIREMLRKGGFI
jgi:FlaA1/EpsC-like NDP-sugar epimerase